MIRWFASAWVFAQGLNLHEELHEFFGLQKADTEASKLDFDHAKC